jgi:LuxR family maltose regulon positive regulatory protein
MIRSSTTTITAPASHLWRVKRRRYSPNTLTAAEPEKGGLQMVATTEYLERPARSSAPALAPPPFVATLPTPCLRRPRLDAQLTFGTQGRLTVVTGPPGAGKTTLLADWARRRPAAQTRWISLRAIDNDPTRFWRQVHVSVGGALHADEALPTVLVVDDFQVIDNRQIISAFGAFLGGLPSHVRVVVSSRSDPDLRLHRLRLSGELTEIRPGDLRFTLAETGEFFMLISSNPPGRDALRAFADLTEGWATGLRMVATELGAGHAASSLARRFSGEFGPVADYFRSEVVERLPAHESQFLFQTSALELLSGGVCQQLSGRADALRILESLAERNLFVFRVDATGSCYRHHRLFGQFLCGELARADPARARQLRIEAAGWLRGKGDFGGSVHQLVSAGAYDEAFDQAALHDLKRLSIGLPHHAPLLPCGLPDAYLAADPYRMFAVSASLLAAGREAEGMAWLRRVERAGRRHREHRVERPLIEALRAVSAALRADMVSVIRHVERARVPLTRRRTQPGRALSWEPVLDSAVSDQLAPLAARAYLWLDDPERARAELGAQVASDEDRMGLARLGAQAWLACRDGQLQRALGLARQVLEEAGRYGEPPGLATADSYLALTMVLWERHDLGRAAELLEGALAPDDQSGRLFYLWPLECQLIRVLLSRGDVRQALDRLEPLQARGRPPSWSSSLPHPHELESRCWYLLGDQLRGLSALECVPPPNRSEELLAWAELCAGCPGPARERLVAALRRPAAACVHMRRLALLARAEAQLGQERQAELVLRQAVEKSRDEGYITMYVEDAPELLPLLKRIAGRFPDAYLSKLVEHAECANGPINPSGVPPIPEPLSGREHEVLTYLPSHRSQREIAAEMFVSLNTVKTHVQAVYRKLGVRSRSQAVTVARAQNLLR